MHVYTHVCADFSFAFMPDSMDKIIAHFLNEGPDFKQ